jgi:hypothetical protein
MSVGQVQPSEQVAHAHLASPLEVTLDHFDVTDAVLRDGVSELSLKKIDGLHLGFEEIVRDRIEQDPSTVSPHFSLHLQGKTIRELLDELCKTDPRYTWLQDGATVNIYPRSIVGDASYLLNLNIDRIVVKDAPDADHALTPLFKQFPEQQIGYFGPGLGSDDYDAPWTAGFNSLTVRQFINRIAEHMGPRTSWVWEGGQKERMFTFLKDGFNTFRPADSTKPSGTGLIKKSQ